jgi:hypothetical protein
MSFRYVQVSCWHHFQRWKTYGTLQKLSTTVFILIQVRIQYSEVRIRKSGTKMSHCFIHCCTYGTHFLQCVTANLFSLFFPCLGIALLDMNIFSIHVFSLRYLRNSCYILTFCTKFCFQNFFVWNLDKRKLYLCRVNL